MENFKFTLSVFVKVFIIGFPFYACSPIFSEMQTAKLVGKDSITIMPFISSSPNTFYREIDDMYKQRQIGIAIERGIADIVDFRYDYTPKSQVFLITRSIIHIRH